MGCLADLALLHHPSPTNTCDIQLGKNKDKERHHAHSQLIFLTEELILYRESQISGAHLWFKTPFKVPMT